MPNNQYVCEVCGFNMIGYYPDNCPFCGASKENFITAAECSEKYKLKTKEITHNVYQLTSTPQLGLEHAAYMIQLEKEIIWIDCPSTFQKEVNNMNILLFTHHHFLAAANLYQEYFNSKLWIHEKDAFNSISTHYNFNKTFDFNFNYKEIKAYHIDGHTSGFTFYIFHDALFICDYIFVKSDESLRFNPYGPREKTQKGAQTMVEIIDKYSLSHVCGYNYTMSYDDWIKLFRKLI